MKEPRGAETYRAARRNEARDTRPHAHTHQDVLRASRQGSVPEGEKDRYERTRTTAR